MLARNVGVSGRLTRLDLQDRVAVAPVEALQDNVRLVAKPREAAQRGEENWGRGDRPTSLSGGVRPPTTFMTPRPTTLTFTPWAVLYPTTTTPADAGANPRTGPWGANARGPDFRGRLSGLPF